MQAQVNVLSRSALHLHNSEISVLVDPDLSQKLPDGNIQFVLLTGRHPQNYTKVSLNHFIDAYPRVKIVIPETVNNKNIDVLSAMKNLLIASDDSVSLKEGLEVSFLKEKAISEAIEGYVIVVGMSKIFVASENLEINHHLIDRLKALGTWHTLVLPVKSHNRLQIERATEKPSQFAPNEAISFAKELNAQQLVVQTDADSTDKEVRFAHQHLECNANLLVNPELFHVGKPKTSVVIRTLNEERYLDELLKEIANQQSNSLDCEVVLVDSGSTDQTVSIAERHGCRILHISRDEFSFGRSLNIGCQAANGDIIVITSGHCVPASKDWLQKLCQPLIDGVAQYSYGKQIGGSTSQFSECRVFEKYFPSTSRLPQDGFYCNNANAALLKATWMKYRFNEELTGLEDMELAQRLVQGGGHVAYVAEAPVIHHHSETWPQVRRRFEREAIALQQIMPNIHVGLIDAIRYTISSIWGDFRRAHQQRVLWKNLINIVRYRYYQYSGSYRGNQQHRKLSHAEKDRYFYPH